MPLSGPSVHQQLMSGYAELQAKLQAAHHHITSAAEQRASLDDDRGAAMLRLAEHYLPELTPDAVSDSWRELRPSMERILARKQDHTNRTQARLQELTSRRERLDAELVSLNERLDEAVSRQQELAAQVESQLQGDPQFAELSDRAAVAEAALERAEENLQGIEQDAEKKLPAYHDSALFTYLRDRQFGTAQYASRGFTRRMDRAVAKLIDYSKAKRNYEFLLTTPVQMRQIIENDRQALDTVMDELERQRDRVALRLGLPAALTAIETLQQQRSAQLSELDELLQQTESVRAELTSLDQTRGPYYREAIELVRGMLGRLDSRELERRAGATPDLTDDQIVAGLQGVETNIEKLDGKARDYQAEIAHLQQNLDGLGRLIQRFRAAKFDGASCQFVGNFDIVSDLDRAIDQHGMDWLWDRIREAQSWGPTAMEQVTKIATHPMTQILINAMAHAAGGALEAHARRAGHRRGRRGPSWGGSGSGTWGGDSSGWYRRR